MSNRIEIVSEDLAKELNRCPNCGESAVIHSRMWTADGRLPRRQISIVCNAGCEDEFRWHDSLYEAVSVWEVRAKMLVMPGKIPSPWHDDYEDDPPWEQARHPDAF